MNPTMSLLSAARSKPISQYEPIKAVPDLPSAKEPAVSPQFLEQMEKQFTDDIVTKNVLELPISSRADLQANPSSKGDYLERLGQYEGSSSYTANREGSKYYGKYQFDEPTAKPYLDKIGKTWNDFKLIPDVQDQVADLSTQANADLLQAKGIEPTMRNLYMLHQQGRTGGLKILGGGSTNNMFNNMPGNLPKTRDAYMNYWANKWK